MRIWAKEGTHTFVLSGRNISALDATKQDLSIRYPKSEFKTLEVPGSESSLDPLLPNLEAEKFDLCLIAIGSNISQKLAESKQTYLMEQLLTTGVYVVALTALVADVFEKQGFGTIGVIGSVAGDRGRAYNHAYGSAKAMVETYTEGLQQRLAGTNVKVSLIKPGPTATPMTANHGSRLTDPIKVAALITKGLARGKTKIYAPAYWRYIMLIVRAIPFFIFRKLTF